MLSRDVTYLSEYVATEHELKLTKTLSGYMPDEWNLPVTTKYPVLPAGHHLIWFNPAFPEHELLHDGTDTSQSPGGPWIRRMWAGGSVHFKPDRYFSRKKGFTVGSTLIGAERIKEVKLRGQGDDAKIFVTIERRFAREGALSAASAKIRTTAEKADEVDVGKYFKEQLRDDMEWGDAICKEERNLVFFKERSAAELEDIKAGKVADVRYLDPPSTPDFSHILTPTRSLLFRFSALTFNAHLLHLDRDYARNVEGHRNLLVHGPLSLVMLLQAIQYHVRLRTQGQEVISGIEYRNLTPLYCDEKMRICGHEKNSTGTGSTYDVWIEGPTGGVAVKGTVQTFLKTFVAKHIGQPFQIRIVPSGPITKGSEGGDGLKATRESSNTSEQTPSQLSTLAREVIAEDEARQDDPHSQELRRASPADVQKQLDGSRNDSV
ncbi:hypothetical protein ACN47E_003414 [Coniothyrium glycines]